MATIEDFSRIDLRVGKIVGVEEIEKARGPLYRLSVDLGGELGTRTIVAGIKNQYTKDLLMDKKIVCIVNLDPKTVAGVESQGMLLAAGEGEAIAILVPDKEIAEGSKVH